LKFALNIPLASIVPSAPAGERAATVRTMARALEEAGLSACLTSEHPAPSAQWFKNDPGAHDCVDPLTALAFVAGATERLKVFTNVLILPYRNPFLAAKQAASLQVMSDNRLLLGVGVGYMQAEFDALGVDFKERGALMDEAIETIRLAWSGGAVSAKGRHFDAHEVEPRPVPDPAPPIWIGGGSDRALERAARHGDGWVPYFTVPTNSPDVRRSAVVDMDHFGEKLAKLRERRAELGRTGPFDISVAPPFRPKEASGANARRFLDEVAQLARHGVNWAWTSVPARSLEEYLDIVRWFGEEVVAGYAKG
jgi:probable F420-dependent oxidoreductase